MTEADLLCRAKVVARAMRDAAAAGQFEQIVALDNEQKTLLSQWARGRDSSPLSPREREDLLEMRADIDATCAVCEKVRDQAAQSSAQFSESRHAAERYLSGAKIGE